MTGKVVELSGTSGAGKSSVAQLLASKQSIQPVHIAQRCPTLWLIWGALHNPKFILFCFAQISKRRVPIGFSLRLLGNVVRALGRYEWARNMDHPCGVILIDEGPTNLAQTIFAVGHDPIDPQAVLRFHELCPRPDYLVLLKAELPTLLDRAKTRSDPPIKNAPPEALALFLERCQLVFELVAGSLRRARCPTLVVETNSKQELDDAAKRISEWIEPNTATCQRNYS